MPRRVASTWVAVLVTTVWAVLVTLPAAGAAGPQPRPAAPEPALSRPFISHRDGYDCYRIPALVTTRSGTLLAFAEGRLTDCADIGNIDVVLKRSTDGGRTWSDLMVLRGADSRGTFGTPVPVVDQISGRVSLLFAHNSWADDGDRRVRRTRTLHSVHSMDEGLTWSPGGVLGALKPAHWTWVSVGPGHGVQLRRGPYAGRLVVAGDHRTHRGKSGGQLYYSDDGGLTWQLGAVYEIAREEAYPAELTVVELVDGSLYVNARSSRPGPGHYRLAAASEDGGLSFTADGFAPAPGLAAPPVSASLLRLRATDNGDPRNRLLLSVPAQPGPHTATRRRTMTIRSSYDEGLTWQDTAPVITPARAGYSDLTELLTGEIGLVYETGVNSSHGTIKFTAFTAASLDGGAPRHPLCARPPAAGSAWMADDRGAARIRAAATVNRRTPSALPRSATVRRLPR
jgi:sialidase-1